jgi:hypothetical protein
MQQSSGELASGCRVAAFSAVVWQVRGMIAGSGQVHCWTVADVCSMVLSCLLAANTQQLCALLVRFNR